MICIPSLSLSLSLSSKVNQENVENFLGSYLEISLSRCLSPFATFLFSNIHDADMTMQVASKTTEHEHSRRGTVGKHSEATQKSLFPTLLYSSPFPLHGRPFLSPQNKEPKRNDLDPSPSLIPLSLFSLSLSSLFSLSLSLSPPPPH